VATYSDDIAAIRNRFIAQWGTTVPFVFDNEPPIDEPSTIWVRLSVKPFGEERPSSLTVLGYGRVYIQVFVPEGLSDGDGWAAANQFNAIFREWHSADYRIRFNMPDFNTSDAESGYFMILGSIPFTATH